MARTAIIFGLLLISVSLGTIAYNGGFKSPSIFIPAGIGAVIGLCGLVGLSEGLRKHAMHLAAAVSLLGGLGCAGMGARLLSKMGTEDAPGPDKLGSVFGTAVLCLVFLALCIKSFIAARKARTA